MYIPLRTITVIYRAALSFLAALGAWVSFATFGASAWRVFITWVLLIATIYYGVSAIMLILNKKRRPNDTPCPMLEGMLIVSLVLCGVVATVCFAQEIDHPMITNLMAALIYVTLPILAFGGWLLFSRKGAWRMVSPFYWLALPLTYAGFILFSVEISSPSIEIPYPLPFFDYRNNDLFNFFSWMFLFAVVILLFGYIMVVLDMVMSGKIAKYIVLPRIKTVPAVSAVPNPDTQSSSKEEPIIAEPIIRKTEPTTQKNTTQKSTPTSAQTFTQAKTQTTDGIKRPQKKKSTNNTTKKPKKDKQNKAPSTPPPSQPKRVEDVEYRKRET